MRTASDLALARHTFGIAGGVLVLWILVKSGPGSAAAAFLPLTFILAVSLLDWVLARRNVRVDPYGVTVSNAFRWHRIAWADVDDITIDGYESVTVLARDRVVTCRALTCAEWPRFPLGLERRRAIRAELASAAT